ncbi:MAG: DNA polymerase I [Trebouxia sp. A1-2]|nr:MAG: DNA polymerase I [Trebouxia sp. A1-2]
MPNPTLPETLRMEFAVVTPVQSSSCNARKGSLPYSVPALQANWTKPTVHTTPVVQQQAPADTSLNCPGNANLCGTVAVKEDAGLAHASAASLQALKLSTHIKASRPLQQKSQAKKHKLLGGNILNSQLSHSPQTALLAAVDVMPGSSTRSMASTDVLTREGVPQVTDECHITSHLSSSDFSKAAAPGMIVTATEAFQTGTRKKRPRRQLLQTVLPSAAPESSVLLANRLKQQYSGIQPDRKDAAELDVHHRKIVIPKRKTGKGSNKEEEEEEAMVELAYTDHMVEVTSQALMQQCQQAVKSSAACCLALLMQGGMHGQHYFSTLRPQSKVQNDAALKTAGKWRESGEAVNAAEGKGTPVTHCSQPAAGSASKPGQVLTKPDQVVALAILPVAAHHLPVIFPSPPVHSHGKHPATLPAIAAASPSVTGGVSWGSSGSKPEIDKHPDTSSTAHKGDSFLWVLPCSLLAKSNRSQIGNHALPSEASRMTKKPALTCEHDMLLQHQGTVLLHTLLSGSQSAVCFDIQGVCGKLSRLGCQLPEACQVRLKDPKLMAWLHEPQLMQRDEKQIEGYGVPTPSEHPLPPLQQLKSDMLQAVQLTAALEGCTMPYLPQKVLQVETQIAVILAQMEFDGMGFNAQHLLHHERCLRTQIADIEQQAAQLVGSSINLSSASQLSIALYDTLALPTPQQRSDRGSARTHHPTDEVVLKQLTGLHPLPALILEYRCMHNILTKWIQPPWVQQIAAFSAGGQVRVRCSWNQTATATGRLSSSSPNLQVGNRLFFAQPQGPLNQTAVTKYTTSARGVPPEPHAPSGSGSSKQDINIRDAFVASPGCLLVAADYSQVELRVLAHLSGDTKLIQILRQAGVGGDAFALIAKTWLRKPHDTDTAVLSEEREKAKRVTYGIIYGLSPWGRAKGPGGLGMQVGQAQNLITSFLNHFSGLKQFLEKTKHEGRSRGYITTFSGRRRPIKALGSSEQGCMPAASQRAAAEADRKAVNSTIQGSAADLIKLAMCSWAAWQHAHPASKPHSDEQAVWAPAAWGIWWQQRLAWPKLQIGFINLHTAAQQPWKVQQEERVPDLGHCHAWKAQEQLLSDRVQQGQGQGYG